MKGDDRANELCTSRISSEFDSASPRSFRYGQQPFDLDKDPISVHTSDGKAPVNSLNSFSCGPISTSPSLFSSTESKAWVPQAFCMVCAAKKRFSAPSKSKFPSRGVPLDLSPVGYLKRKMTPYTGLPGQHSQPRIDTSQI